jgi:DNA repair protein RadC
VDSRLHLLRIEKIADGAFGEVAVDQRKIISCGLRIGAAGFILVHNHPSGTPQPSQADLSLSSRLKRLAGELDLHLLDHLIVARGQMGSIVDYWQEAQWSKRPSE